MSILLFVIGAITLVLGALAIGFGIPINEFSFGNTLIVTGTTAAVGGLIVIGLGAVVAHLQRVVDVIALRAPLRPNRAPDMLEAGRAPPAGRIPFPPKPKPEAAEAPAVEPPAAAAAAAAMAAEEFPPQAEAPTLPNPDVPLAEAAEEVPPVLPPFAAPSPAAELGEPAAPESKPPFSFNGLGTEEPPLEPAPAWLSASPRPAEPPRASDEAYFESVWPTAEDRAASRLVVEEEQPAPVEPSPPAAAAPAAPEPEPEAPASERRAVAILKSGVVDGMGYTLYVDGSIEAELPQGTLRFASINDLREHLEKTS